MPSFTVEASIWYGFATGMVVMRLCEDSQLILLRLTDGSTSRFVHFGPHVRALQAEDWLMLLTMVGLTTCDFCRHD